MANDIKYDVKLCIKQKIYTIQMTGNVLQGIKTNGLADSTVQSLEQMEDYTVTLKQYDTPVETLSAAPALENMQIDKEASDIFSNFPCCLSLNVMLTTSTFQAISGPCMFYIKLDRSTESSPGSPGW